MIGKTFGRLTVTGEAGFAKAANGRNHRVYTCECTCGTIKLIRRRNLRMGRTNSCGCIKKEGCFKNFRNHIPTTPAPPPPPPPSRFYNPADQRFGR